MQFMCKGEEAMALRTSDMQLVLDVDLENFMLTVQLDTVYIDSINEIRTVIGKHDAQAIADFIDTGAYIAIPVINGYLPPMAVPKKLSDTLSFKALTLEAHEKYAYFTVGLEVTPQ